MTKTDHKPTCPKIMVWDGGEEIPCTCGGPYLVDKDGTLRDDYYGHDVREVTR